MDVGDNLVAREHVLVGARRYPVWPPGQKVHVFEHRDILITRFDDAAQINPILVRDIDALGDDPQFLGRAARAYAGRKLYHLQRWTSPAAALLNARALALASRALRSPTAFIDLSWANIYRRGDYSMPHSHERTAASVVYCVDAGSADPADPLSGQLVLVDPRVEACCKVRRGAVTTPLMPIMRPGTMILFPSALVHAVNPYTGERPRITLAWNIDKDIVPGKALPPEALAHPA
jgi:hypothetical protein